LESHDEHPPLKARICVARGGCFFVPGSSSSLRTAIDREETLPRTLGQVIRFSSLAFNGPRSRSWQSP
jgi:hypothetical protein